MFIELSLDVSLTPRGQQHGTRTRFTVGGPHSTSPICYNNHHPSHHRSFWDSLENPRSNRVLILVSRYHLPSCDLISHSTNILFCVLYTKSGSSTSYASLDECQHYDLGILVPPLASRLNQLVVDILREE